MKTEFSIIIPVYNAAGTLAETLKSVADQSYQNFEVIIVNDGSTDNSGDIIDQWTSQVVFPVTHFKQDNLGLGAARNKGIELSQHTWLALLDADDIWLRDKLFRISKLISEGETSFIYHQVKTFGLGKARVRKAYQVETVDDMIAHGNPIVPSATIFRKEIWEEFPFSEKREHNGAEDFHLWLRLLHAGYKLHYHNEVLTLYREIGGMSTDLSEHLEYVNKVIEDLNQKGLLEHEMLELIQQRKNYEAARFYQKRGMFKKAARHYALSGQSGWKFHLLQLSNRLGLSI